MEGCPQGFQSSHVLTPPGVPLSPAEPLSQHCPEVCCRCSDQVDGVGLDGLNLVGVETQAYGDPFPLCLAWDELLHQDTIVMGLDQRTSRLLGWGSLLLRASIIVLWGLGVWLIPWRRNNTSLNCRVYLATVVDYMCGSLGRPTRRQCALQDGSQLAEGLVE